MGAGRPPTAGHDIAFPPYRLKLDAELLLCGTQPMPLRPKTFAVLRYLAERPGVLVTKDELLDAVWTGLAVTEGTLNKSVAEIREALEDDARHPRFLETVHRRGFRFLGTGPHGERHPDGSVALSGTQRPVGRDAELARLHAHLETARHGARQVVFITGEAGVGKTTLVETFLASIPGGRRAVSVWTARGQCVRRDSAHEPYMPVLEALARLARGPHAGRVTRLLRERAPTWLVQLPWLLSPDDVRGLEAGVAGATPERMLRVFMEFLEGLTADLTLVLALEDIHWADPSTLDLVSMIAQRTEPARVVLLCTYRPAEAIVHGGMLDRMRRELAVHHQCTELGLAWLSLANVEEYLGARFGGTGAPTELARLLHAHTDGNPLFLVTAVDHLLAQGWIERVGDGVQLRADIEALDRQIPWSLRDLVETQLIELDPFDLALLEAGSVAGLEFSAQALAAAVRVDVERVEDICERLVRSHRFLRSADPDPWPDGSVGTRYLFAHAVYQRLLYDRIPGARRQLLHHRLAERLEAGYVSLTEEIAADLAGHFEKSREAARAVPYLATAAARAARRFAPRESAAHARRGLALLEAEPDGPERRRQELALRCALGAAAAPLSGYGSEDAWSNYERARQLAEEVGETRVLFGIVYALAASSLLASDAGRVADLLPELARTAAQVGTEEAALLVDIARAYVGLWRGDLRDAHGLASLRKVDPAILADVSTGSNPVLLAAAGESWRLWLVGCPDEALTAARFATTLAAEQANPINLVMTLFFAAQVFAWRGDLSEAAALTVRGRTRAAECGFGFWSIVFRALGGMLSVRCGDLERGIDALRTTLAQLRAAGVGMYVPAFLTALAEAQLRRGNVADASITIGEGLAFVRARLDRTHVAELWRTKGDILAAAGAASDDVEHCFAQALDVARAQGALAFELRAAHGLARHLVARRRRAEARELVAPCYARFTEGLETTDLRAVRDMLDSLGT